MIDKHNRIKKDKKPYIIFKCPNCEQYMYVKPSQKSKKCLRCEKTYSVEKIKIHFKVEIVKGMSNAVERVKDLQNQFAIKNLKEKPKLKSQNTFFTPTNINSTHIRNKKTIETMQKNTLERQFTELLEVLSEQFNEFPKYMIELMAKEYDIEQKDLEILIRTFLKNGKLEMINNKYFKIN
jgi:hypothetical protein